MKQPKDETYITYAGNSKKLGEFYEYYLNSDKKLPQEQTPSWNSQSFEKVKILYVGTSFQTTLLQPFLEKLIDLKPANKKIQLVTVVNKSSYEISRTTNETSKTADKNILFKDMVLSKENWGFWEDKVEFYPDFRENGDVSDYKKTIEVDFSQQKIEDSITNEEIKELIAAKKFDFIFCFFENHFEVNWRVGLLNLLPYLKDRGDYVFADITGNFELLDGNFKHADYDLSDEDNKQIKKLLHLLKKFDKARSKLHYWKPEISVTNYKEMRGQIGRLFDQVIDKEEPQEQNGNPSSFFKAADKITLTRDKLLDVIKNENLRYFRLGIHGDANFKAKLEKKLKKKFSDEYRFTFTSDLHIYWARGFKKAWLDGLKSREWNFSALLKDLQQINDHTLSSLGSKALDILASHDMILPNHTNYLALIEWTDPKSNDWTYPIHFLINERVYFGFDNYKKLTGEQLKNVLAENAKNWFQEEKNLGASLAQAIFQKTKRKNIFRFVCLDESKLNSAKENYTCLAIQSSNLYELLAFPSIYYTISRDRKGNIKELNIFFSRNWPNKNPDIDLDSEFIDVKRQEIIPGVLSKYQIQKPFNFAVNDLGAKNHSFVEAIKQSDHIELFEAFNIKYQEELEVVLQLIIFSHFYTSTRDNHELVFYPSAIIEVKDRPDALEGLGGIILYEECINTKDTTLKTLYTARNKALVDATNLIFYKASIVSHVDQDFKRHARKAAIAAINARNSSHVIGSHVLPEIINSNKFDIKDHKVFFRYLMRRGEYIAQLTSEFPTWSVPTWLGKEVMAEFYNQQCLLDSIACAEGIQSYDGSASNKYHQLVINLRKRCWDEVIDNRECKPVNEEVSKYLNIYPVVNLADEQLSLNDGEEALKKYYGIIIKGDKEYGFLYFAKNESSENEPYDKIGPYRVLKLNEFDPPLSEDLKEELFTGRRAIVNAKLSSDRKSLENVKILELSKIVELVSPCKHVDKNDLLYSDVQISIPGGITGYHALYIILENVIRNAAKHDWYQLPSEERMGKNFIVNVEVEEKKTTKDNFYVCKAWTNCSNAYQYTPNEIYLSDKENKANLRTTLNSFLEKDIISLKGKPIKDHLGISEIKLNATFLYNKELDNDENIEGKGIILNDKHFDLDGHIKASAIWDFDSDKNLLIPHLGYRFKLLKPKEVLIVSNKKEEILKNNNIDYASLKQHSIEILKHEEALSKENRQRRSKLEYYSSELLSNGLDYEFCVIFPVDTPGVFDKEAIDKLTFYELLFYFISFLRSPRDVEDVDAYLYSIFDRVVDVIEAYPYRLFMALEKDSPIYSFFSSIKTLLNEQEQPYWQELNFIRSRIFFLEVNTAFLAIPLEEFKNYLYEQWVRIYQISSDSGLSNKSKNKFDSFFNFGCIRKNRNQDKAEISYKLIINARTGSTDVSNDYHHSKTLPSIYKELSYEKKNNENFYHEYTKKKGLQEPLETQADPYLIKYIRHLSSKDTNEGANYYVDEISGRSSSFFRFHSFFDPKTNTHIKNKLINFFFENAFSVIMVIDERLLKFMEENQSLSEINRGFLLKNIIIPYEISINSEVKYKRDYRNEKTIENKKIIGNEKEINFTNEKAEKIIIRFIQPELSQRKENRQKVNEYVVNTLIIHQSFLEKFAGKNAEMDKSKENNLIKKLKIEYKIPSIIICTGRGRASYESYRYAKYVPFSIIEGTLMKKNPDKLSLMDLLFKTLN